MLGRLQEEEAEVAAVIRGKAPQRPDNPNLTFITADILDYKTLREEIKGFQPQIIFHLAGVRPLGRSWAAIQQAYQTNLMGTMNLLRSLQDMDCHSVVMVGSTAEYGRSPAPYRENQIQRPISAYGAAKAAATALGSLCWEYFRLPVTVLRPTLVYGPGQGEHLFFSQLVRSVLAGRPFAMTAGEQYRDFVYIDDVIEALWLAANTPRAAGGTFNIGSGFSIPLRQMAESVCSSIGCTDLLHMGAKPYGPDEQFAYCVDIQLAKQVLQWQPFTPLEQGVAATIEWFRQVHHKK